MNGSCKNLELAHSFMLQHKIDAEVSLLFLFIVVGFVFGVLGFFGNCLNPFGTLQSHVIFRMTE